MESPMHRWQYIVPDLQAPRRADPGQRALHDPADLAQAAAVRRPLPRQVILDPALLEALSVPWRAVLPVSGQRLRLPPRPAALAATVVLLVTVWFHWIVQSQGFSGAEKSILWAAITFYFFAHGGGPYSVDRLIGKEL